MTMICWYISLFDMRYDIPMMSCNLEGRQNSQPIVANHDLTHIVFPVSCEFILFLKLLLKEKVASSL